MPTPFYHAQQAEDMLRQLSGSAPKRCLQSHRPAFLLGSTAPDVQTISGQKRSETHFFELPLQPAGLLPWKRMLAAHPGLAGCACHPRRIGGGCARSLLLCLARAVSEVISRLPRVQLEVYRQELWAETIQLLESLIEKRFS